MTVKLIDSTQAKQLEKTIQSLIAKWEKLVIERNSIDDEKTKLQSEILSLKKSFEGLTGQSPRVKFKLPDFVSPTSGENAKIGDAMEDILLERKALKTQELIDLLRTRGVRVSLRNPRIVIANTIKQDRYKRFVRLEDKRIALRK